LGVHPKKGHQKVLKKQQWELATDAKSEVRTGADRPPVIPQSVNFLT